MVNVLRLFKYVDKVLLREKISEQSRKWIRILKNVVAFRSLDTESFSDNAHNQPQPLSMHQLSTWHQDWYEEFEVIENTAKNLSKAQRDFGCLD